MSEQANETWVKLYLPLLREMADGYVRLPGSGRIRKQMAHDMKHNGIPLTMRGQAWPLLIGNKIRVTPQLYEHYKNYMYASEAFSAADNNNGETKHLIEADIPRTFPELNNLFAQVESLSGNLRELLVAYSHMRPEIGYVQGMAHIAGMILLHCGTPQECFKMFANIVSLELLYDFYSIDNLRIRVTYKVFWRILSQTCPILYGCLIEESMVSCSIFLLGWILTLYSGTFDICIASVMWDQIF